MKNIAFFLSLPILALLAMPARADDAAAPAPANDPQSQKIIDATAHSVQDSVEKLGFTKLVWSKVANQGQIVTLQYMPEDLEDPAQWSRMLEVTVYGLAGDPKSDLDAEKRLVHMLETQYTRMAGGQLTEDQNFIMNDGKDVGMFIQYTLNPNTPEQMTAAGSFLRLTDKSAYYVQLDARTRPLKKKEAVVMQKLVNPLADGSPVVAPRGKK